MHYRELFLGLAISLGVVGLVLRVIAPIMAPTPPEVQVIGVALIVLSIVAVAGGTALAAETDASRGGKADLP